MNGGIRLKMLEMADEADVITDVYDAKKWAARARAFLSMALGPDEADRFANLRAFSDFETLALQRGHLEGLAIKAEATIPVEAPSMPSVDGLDERPFGVNSRKVFVVHGHDDAAKDRVALFLQKVKLDTIILHEQPNGGRTIIEKFETYSGDVAFAVVLLTPDDRWDDTSRARQNVIMELGYFIGRLGRTRVCALHKGKVELPSDYQGVLYVEMDDSGTWKNKLAQELVQAKVPIDLSALLGG